MSQANAELRHAGEDPSVAAVQVRVPQQAGVEDLGQSSSKGAADGEASAAERHVERVLDILLVALGAAPDVEPPLVVVLRQRPDQVVDKEHRVVVAEHEPPDAGLAAVNGLLDHARDADRRSEAAGEGVGEAGGVLGDDHRRKIGIGLGFEAVEEDEGARGLVVVPEADVGLAAGPGAGGGGDGEQEVAAAGDGDGGGEGKGEAGRVLAEEEEEDEEEGEEQEEGLEAGGSEEGDGHSLASVVVDVTVELLHYIGSRRTIGERRRWRWLFTR
ncbi:hypothetical protein TIFTF001_027176 [Ficus carica]|uniref:Uncharacterized protein n=1 Tax=Ficus carica TaxID=3494 RepID=A0AA88DNR7_FICCA|nr:hypothetical protein TIFTF001_027176 [Ficus carica]